MDIQSTFYLLASIFMVLGIIVLILGIIAMIMMLVFIRRMKTSAEEFQRKVKENVQNVFSARKFAGIFPLIGAAVKWMAERRKKQADSE